MNANITIFLTLRMEITKFLSWIKAGGGWLYILACYAIMLTFQPMVDIWWAKAIAAATIISKKVVDVLLGKSDAKQALHDFACAAIGVLLTDCVIFVWWLCS